MNLNLVLLIGFGLLKMGEVFCAPGLSPPDAIDDDFSNHQAIQSCGDLDDTCVGCLTLENCKFAYFDNSETKCVDAKLTEEQIGNMSPNSTLEDVTLSEEKCSQSQNGDDKPGTQIPPKFNTSLAPENETTTTPLTPSTSATSTNTTKASTTASTTTSTTSESTTPSTTSTAKPTTLTTSSSTTTKNASTVTTASPIISTTPVDPSGKTGSKFDGWSFFGGILLTIGLSAIGFVSFKYYKVRSGSHANTNYNRF